MNKVELDGFVGQEPQIRSTKNGNEFAVFSLATNENFKNSKGSWQENTTWHNIVLWSDQLDSVKDQLRKGIRLYIEGRIVNRSYTDKNGDKRYVSEVVGTNVRHITAEISDAE